MLSANYADIVGPLGVEPFAGAPEPWQRHEDTFETHAWLEDVEIEERDPNQVSAEYTAPAALFGEPRMHRSIGLTTPSASTWALSQVVPDLETTGLNQGG